MFLEDYYSFKGYFYFIDKFSYYQVHNFLGEINQLNLYLIYTAKYSKKILITFFIIVNLIEGDIY